MLLTAFIHINRKVLPSLVKNAMDAQDALRLVDQLVYDNTGKYLSDLERQVFLGSWNDQTYSEIYPQNPEYVEKVLGYRLWQKLTEVLGEKVTKKRLHGAFERRFVAQSPQLQIFISYRGKGDDLILAHGLFDALTSQGYIPTISNLDETVTPAHTTQLKTELQQSHGFVLILSSQSALSEMMLELLQLLHGWSDKTLQTRPKLLAILIDSGESLVLPHDVRCYLETFTTWEWHPDSGFKAVLDWLTEALQESNCAVTPPNHLHSHEPETGSHTSRLESHKLQHESQHEPQQDPLYPDQGLSGAQSATSGKDASPQPSLPLPSAEPEIPQGQVRLASIFYVERMPQEQQCYEAVGRPGALIRLKAPRQMGKTSLMARILHRAQKQGYRAIPITFQHADRATFQDLGCLLRWFCTKVARKLTLAPQINERWVDTYGSKDNCTAYFEDYILPEINSPLVLGLDEVDAVFQYPTIAADFFGLLRAWYEEASYGSDDSELWERLRLVVVHSTEVYLPLDINQSPFNVGLPVDLPVFTPIQVMDLAQRHNLTWSTEQVSSLMNLVGGHPYLIRLALYHLAYRQLSLSELRTKAPTEEGIFSDHLRRLLWQIEQNNELVSAYQAILQASSPVSLDSKKMFQLHSLGLVHLRGNGAVPSFELYRQYFSDRLSPTDS